MRGSTCIFWTNLTPFTLEADIDTPALIVELDTLEENLARMQACRVNSYRNLRKMLFNVGFGLRQAIADAHGVGLRPHFKMHKCPALALRQVEMGAIGLCCQKVGEAEVMARAANTGGGGHATPSHPVEDHLGHIQIGKLP
jgi:hypothetical protein